MDLKNIGIAIRNARTMAHMTQKELAEKIGVSQISISLWEQGKNSPSAEYIILLNSILNTNILDDRNLNNKLLDEEVKLELRLEKKLEEKIEEKIEEKFKKILSIFHIQNGQPT